MKAALCQEQETAATSPPEALPETDEGARTGLPLGIAGIPFRRKGLLLASVVPRAALSADWPTGLSEFSRRRREALAAHSSTMMPAEVDPSLLDEVREIFDQGASEVFHDGLHSGFSRRLLRTMEEHGQDAFRAIAQYVFSGSAKPDVVSEALRWLADFNDPSTLSQRWAILQRTLNNPSPQVRDGAILGFAALDDPAARPLLLNARNWEQIAELRALIDQVVAQLGRAR